MNKVILIGLVILLSLSACSSTDAVPAEAIDIAATVDAAANTKVAATFAALSVSATEDASVALELDEATATATEVILPSETPTLEPSPTATEAETESATPDGILSTEGAPATPAGTLPAETATIDPDGTLVVTATGTLEAVATSIYPSPTSPISVNMPPDSIPRYKIKIINNTKVKVYISLQGVTEGGYHPIIEYDFDPWEKARFPIPEGKYTAIVYVGKDPMVGTFSIHSNNSIDIIIEKDKLKIKK